MWKRVGKRLFILLPAVWLIASAVFLLSRTMPGNAAADLFEQQGQTLNAAVKAEARREAYRQLLHRTGQDLPLFYFSFGAAAEPDTLYRIFPETDRQALQNLALIYGNWPQISAFYRNWALLKANIAAESRKSEARQRQLTLLNDILLQPATGKAKIDFNAFRSPNGAEDPERTKLIAATEKTYQEMLDKSDRLATFLPVLHWHGRQNQYHRWFSNLLRGNLGQSNRDARPVSAVIAEAFQFTFWLAFSALLVTGLLAPEIAMFLSRKSKMPWQKPVLGLLYSLESLPLFIVALLVLSLASAAGWLFDFPEEVAWLLALLCLVLVNLPYLTSQSFAALQNVLEQPFILAARSKGISETYLLRHHALRNSLLPLITLLSDFFPSLLAGSVVLEVIFSLPGMGRLLVNAVLNRDYEVITGLVLLTGLFKIGAHLLGDILYAAADPRLRSENAL